MPHHKERRSFTQKELLEIGELAGKGMRIEMIGPRFGLSRDYFKSLAEQDEALRHAIDNGIARVHDEATKIFFEEAFGKRIIPLMIFWMKTQGRWQEPKTELEIKAIAAKETFEDYITKLEQENERQTHTIEVEAESSSDSGATSSRSISVLRS